LWLILWTPWCAPSLWELWALRGPLLREQVVGGQERWLVVAPWVPVVQWALVLHIVVRVVVVLLLCLKCVMLPKLPGCMMAGMEGLVVRVLGMERHLLELLELTFGLYGRLGV
jgi:hypothetical protein